MDMPIFFMFETAKAKTRTGSLHEEKLPDSESPQDPTYYCQVSREFPNIILPPNGEKLSFQLCS